MNFFRVLVIPIGDFTQVVHWRVIVRAYQVKVKKVGRWYGAAAVHPQDRRSRHHPDPLSINHPLATNSPLSEYCKATSQLHVQHPPQVFACRLLRDDLLPKTNPLRPAPL